jgi:hypothetical protein
MSQRNPPEDPTTRRERGLKEAVEKERIPDEQTQNERILSNLQHVHHGKAIPKIEKEREQSAPCAQKRACQQINAHGGKEKEQQIGRHNRYHRIRMRESKDPD